MWFLILVAFGIIIWLLWTIAQNTGDMLHRQTSIQNELVRLNKQLEDSSGQAVSASTPLEKIDLNSASVNKLMTLPGIGKAMAQKIVDARPFTNTEELTNIAGFNQDLFEKIRNQISVGGI